MAGERHSCHLLSSRSGASLQEGGGSQSGEILKLGVGNNLESVSVRGHVVSLIDQCPDPILVTLGHDEG